MAELFSSPAFWFSLTTLTFLEIVLGIDNIVFISIAAGKLPPAEQPRARSMGLWIAMALRIAMLGGLVWITKLSGELFQLPGFMHGIAAASGVEHPEDVISISAKDLILLAGGLFLLGKATLEIHHSIEGGHDEAARSGAAATFASALVQIGVINIVFSIDSVITAVGMTDNLVVMVIAVIASTLVMMIAAKPVSDFINEHPTTKMLALAFILLIGVALVADGLGVHIPRGYLYFAIFFSLFVEVMNVMARSRKPAPAH